MPSQDGRTFVVTGGAGGLGLEVSRALAAIGADVVLAVRSPEKGNAAAARIRSTGVRGSVQVRSLDVSDLSSVRDFAEQLPGVDVLVNNAGVMAVPRATSVDGFELQFATNHLGHFALANLLLPKLTDRVVAISSAAHHAGVLDVDDLDMDRRGYAPYAAYAQSKLANLLFVAELQRRLTAAGSRLRATAAHPGYTATGIQGGTGSRFFTKLSDVGNELFGMKPSQGALPVLFAATMDIPGNSYVGPSGFRELVGWPAMVGRTAAASDPDLAKALWARSEELTDVPFPC
jgi:NAD(P)-dependent dehydrogenase (short-subunit alcohol dehydrogenase family)